MILIQFQYKIAANKIHTTDKISHPINKQIYKQNLDQIINVSSNSKEIRRVKIKNCIQCTPNIHKKIIIKIIKNNTKIIFGVCFWVVND